MLKDYASSHDPTFGRVDRSSILRAWHPDLRFMADYQLRTFKLDLTWVRWGWTLVMLSIAALTLEVSTLSFL